MNISNDSSTLQKDVTTNSISNQLWNAYITVWRKNTNIFMKKV